MTENNWINLAVIGQPHGVSGRVKIKSFTDPADDFATHKTLAFEGGAPLKLRITGHTQGMTIVEIDGVTDRNQAELLRGKKLGVVRDTLPKIAAPDQYYIHDLVGMSVLDEQGQPFGTVENVLNYGAGDILEITRTTTGKEELYAFNHATFPVVDHTTRRLTIHPPVILGSRDEEPADEAAAEGRA